MTDDGWRKYDNYTVKDSSTTDFLLEVIANELAEMNRLTILKMKINHGIITSKTDLKEALVDKA